MKIAVALGGNLPGTAAAMTAAVESFRKSGVIDILVSRRIVTPADNCVPETPDFLNCCFTGEYGGTPESLLTLCRQIELRAGRPEVHSSRESRILDCDIIFFGDLEIDTPELTIPHPRCRQRYFVLAPLAEIAGDWQFRDGVTVSAALAALPLTPVSEV